MMMTMMMLILICTSSQLFDSVAEFVKVGTIAPKKFIARLRKEKVEFDNYMQQVTIILQDQKEMNVNV